MYTMYACMIQQQHVEPAFNVVILRLAAASYHSPGGVVVYLEYHYCSVEFEGANVGIELFFQYGAPTNCRERLL